METGTASIWGSLERWRSTAFLVGGTLLLASPLTKGLALFADVSLPVWLVVLFVFPALLASLAGLLGFYPRVADDTPRLALASGVVAALTGGGVTLLFGWVLASNVVPPVRGFIVGSPPGPAFLLVMSSIAAAFVLFGVASLRTEGFSRSTALLLFGFAAPWIVILGAVPVYGGTLPGWFALAAYGVMPVVLLATGYTVRGVTARTEGTRVASDLPTW